MVDDRTTARILGLVTLSLVMVIDVGTYVFAAARLPAENVKMVWIPLGLFTVVAVGVALRFFRQAKHLPDGDFQSRD